MNKKSSPNINILLLLGALVAFGPLSIDMYLPSLPTITEDLNSSLDQVQKTISLFLISFSIGMLFYGPLSDLYGRKRLLIIGIFIYILATLGCSQATSIEQLQVFRFLQGLGGASASVLARALVKDFYDPIAIPKTLSTIHIITMIATLLSPLVGAVIVTYAAWNYIFIFLLCYSSICLIWINISLKVEPTTSNKQSIIKNYILTLSNKSVILFILCLSFSFGGMFAYITASSFVFIEFYQLKPTQYSLIFASNIFSIIIFTKLNNKLLNYLNSFKLLKIFSLVSALSGIYLLMLAILDIKSVWLLIIGLMVFIGTTGPIGTNTMANLLSLMPKNSGTVSGLAVASQFAMGAFLSYIVSLIFQAENPIAMNLVMGCAGILAFVSIFSLNRKTVQLSVKA